MSIGINYSENIYSSLNSRIPMKTKVKFERISNYMRGFFDQLEIENFFTKKLKHDSKITFMLVITALFTFFVLRNVSLIVELNGSRYVLYTFYFVSAALMLYLASLVYKRISVLHHTLSVILTNADSSRNLKKCEAILNNMLLALILFLSAMLFPFIMFAFDLGLWANVVPIILAITAFLYFKRLTALIEGNSNYVASYAASMSVAKI